MSERWTAPVDPEAWHWLPASSTPVVLPEERIFPDEHLELFATKSGREEEFGRSLEAPGRPKADVTRDWIELRWDIPEGVTELWSGLGGSFENSLLRVGFRVYRWRPGEEPVLMATQDANQTYFRDTELPLWRQAFSYCVVTVLEGRIGNLPTLIESKRSPVIDVETLESFSVEVLEGTPEGARVRLSAYLDGRWAPTHPFEVSIGDQLAFQADDVAGGRLLDTGLTLEEVLLVEETVEQPLRRAEFEPDGRRKVDPRTGQPTFVERTGDVAVRTLELRCRDPQKAVRTFHSSPLR